MTEVSFAKSFLSALDARPQRLPADHVEDPREYPARAPYILPRMPKPMTKRTPTTSAPGQERSITVRIKSLRNPPLDIRLSSQPMSTSVLDVKSAVSQQSGGIPLEKLKLLYNKKPVGDSKILKDLVGDGGGEAAVMEFAVMVMGGAASIPAAVAVEQQNLGPHKKEAAAAAAASPVAHSSTANPAQGPSGHDVLSSDEFWTDLKGFLSQRIRDEEVAEEVFGQFLQCWPRDR